eukprot:TRINITY_DN586_c0_g1_i3.p1 TRINITY_DN586_c0_g1~~TRINITY_DN586_c0_g1_i3.p1  ORF type:complete len:515 (-),score=34.68 TRINITY_DN586_c0_g1_i3:596-2140(-)
MSDDQYRRRERLYDRARDSRFDLRSDFGRGSLCDQVDDRRCDKQEVHVTKRARDDRYGPGPRVGGQHVKRKHDSELEFVLAHKHEEWFRLKYDPVCRSQEMDVRKQSVRRKAELFFDQYNAHSVSFPSLVASSNDTDLVSNEAGVNLGQEGVPNDVAIEPISQTDDTNSTELFIQNVPLGWSRQELTTLLEEGAPVVSLVLSEPKWSHRARDYYRVAWAAFATPALCTQCKLACSGRVIRDAPLKLDYNKKPIVSRKNVAPAIASTPAALADHSSLALDVVRILDAKCGVVSNVVLDSAHALSPEIRLQHLAHYLRSVHCLCFYCGHGFTDEHELERRCPRHVRLTAPEASFNKSDGWLHSHRSRLLEYADQLDECQRSLKQAEDDALGQTHVKQEADRCGCGLCTKAFKGLDYVIKHLRAKHSGEERYERTLKLAHDRMMAENYRNDPRRVQPPPPLRPLPVRERPSPPALPATVADPRGIRAYQDVDVPLSDDTVTSQLSDFRTIDYSTLMQ